MNPDTDRFWMIQLWLHIHCSVGYFIKRCISSGTYADDQAVAQILQNYLDHCFDGKILGFDGAELLDVWKYECSHEESYHACEEYLNKQRIRRRFP